MGHASRVSHGSTHDSDGIRRRVPSPLPMLLPIAFAGGMHTGFRLEALEGFETPRHQSVREGFSLDFPGGIARLYVGPTEAAAQEWFVEKSALVARQAPTRLPGLGDEALHSGDGMVLVRDGNIALLVQVRSGARSAADTLLAAIDDAPRPWPAPARLLAEPGGFRVAASEAVHTAYVGGTIRAQPGGLWFHVPPRRVVTWDAWGRATVQDFDERGLPVDTAPPRPAADFVADAPD